jgi:RNA polymerase-binding protein DksA
MDRSALARYRTQLVELRKRLIHDLDDVEQAIREDVAVPGERAGVTSHPADRASEGLDENLALAQNEEHLLADVEAALARLEEGRFGTCQNCGRPVPKERLDAIPYTPWCIDCARSL